MSKQRDLVNIYYEAFQAGDLSGVAVADDVVFTCPFPTVHGSEAFRQAVASSAAMVQSLSIDHQAEIDDVVVTVGDLDFGLPDGPVRFAESIRVTNGEIASVDLIFDSARLAPPA